MATRRRRPAAEARAAILDAAERQLAERGPDGIRLQELAAQVGVSHPAILHHFGNREGLVRAVVARSVAGLEAELIATIATRGPDEEVATGMLERVFEVLAREKHARTLAWLYLAHGGAGGDPIGHGAQLRRVADVVHKMRRQRRGAATPPFEDTLHTVTLASMALFGHAMAGAALESSAGVEPRRFLRWLSRLLVDHLERGRK